MKPEFHLNSKDNKVKHYEPWTAKAVAWDDVRHRYTNLVVNGWKVQGIVLLIDHIIQSGLSGRLYAYTSMDKLVISIYETPETNREALHIQQVAGDKVYFEYWPKPHEPAEMLRTYSEADLIEKFDQYIGWLRW